MKARLMAMADRTDFPLLRRQKLALLRVLDELKTAGRKAEETKLTGILHLLDEFQDSCAEIRGEQTVFGKPRAG